MSTTSTTNPGERSAAEIERDVERTRARLTGTVEELKERVSPNQLAEQAMDWMRGSGGKEFIGNLGTTVRDNPMPVLLVAAGLAWLAVGGRGESRSSNWPGGRMASPPHAGGGSWTGEAWQGESYAGESYPAQTYTGQTYTGERSGPSLGERAGETASDLRARAGNVASRVGETASDLRDRAGDAASRVGEAANEAWQSATGTAQSLAEGAAETARGVVARAGDALGSARGTASQLGGRAGEYGNDARRGIVESFESQPLLMGAVGLALGAALGAIFPATEAEDRLMGETRDRVADRMTALAGDAYGQARETAEEHLGKAGERLGEAYGRAKDRVGETGVSPHGGVAVLGDVARDLREAVEKTAQDVAGSVRVAAERPAPDGTQPGGGTGPSSGGSSTGMPPAKSGPESGGPV